MNSEIITESVILAGGFSTRMSSQKAFLPLLNELTVIEHIVQTYLDARVSSVIVIVNKDIRQKTEEVLEKIHIRGKVSVHVNPQAELGRFSSIHQGLRLSGADYCFLQNIDNPDISVKLLNKMTELVRPETYTAPVFNGKLGHPILISRTVIDHLLKINTCRGNLREELRNFNVNQVEWNDPGIFINMNSENDYAKFKSEFRAHFISKNSERV